MKRILLVLAVLLVMILSGCSGKQEEKELASTPRGTETSAPAEMPTEDSVPTQVPTEDSVPMQAPTEATEPTQIPTEASEPIEMLAEVSDGAENRLPAYLSETKPEITVDNLFQILPSTFLFVDFCDWTTEININEDGTFSGKCSYLDHFDGEDYPFYGKFTEPKKVSEYIYSMKLESLTFNENTDATYYDYNKNSDKVAYTLKQPKGFEKAREFLIYLPGCPLEELPEAYLLECSINPRIRETIPSGVYRMYNVSGKAGFMAEDVDSFWSQQCSTSNAGLRPNYCSKSELWFSKEDSRESLGLVFDWNYDTQTQFAATDRDGTGDYIISLQYSEDYRTMIVTAKNTTVFNLEPWGGTADGTISAEFPVNNRLPFDYLEDTQEDTTIFSMMPSEFWRPGNGSRLSIAINEDGTFTGEYSDSTLGLFGPGFSHGLVSLCNFSGKFTTPQKISEYVYSMSIESQELEEDPAMSYVEDDFYFSMSDGLDTTSEFRIYLPGCPLEDITFPEFSLYDTFEYEIVARCTGVYDTSSRTTIPKGTYVICNLSATEIFSAEDDFWSSEHIYTYGSYRLTLDLNHWEIIFWPEKDGAAQKLEFEWTDDTQTEFAATDSNGTGEYNISLEFSEDNSSVIVTLKSMSGFNLEPWGGTADGTLSAEYQLQ